MHFEALPFELQLAIAWRLDVRERLALGSAFRAAQSLVISTAILRFLRRGQFCGEEDDNKELVVDKLRVSQTTVCPASSSSRKKGHLLPLYEAADPDAQLCRWSHSEMTAAREQHWPWRAFAAHGISRSLVAGSTLPVGLAPEHVSLNLSDATLNLMRRIPDNDHGWVLRPLVPRPALVSFRSSLSVMDLSRAQHLASINAAGLGVLKSVKLPPNVRVACFDGCSQLSELHPTCGATQLVSLQCNGCRKLSGRSFQAGANAAEGNLPVLLSAWHMQSLVELDLSWCTSIDAPILLGMLPTATSLCSVGLRGLALGGVIEALLTSPLANLNAIDLGFTTGLNSATVAAFVDSHARLGRCNLRAAGGITASDYNAIGQLMQARSHQMDIIENRRRNRRRPRHLPPRPAAPFFYLKRGSGSGAAR